MDKFNNYTSKAVAVDSSGVALTAENKNRTALILFNQGSEAVRVYFDIQASYIEIQADQGIHFNSAPINAVNARTTSGTSTITVWEA